MIDTAATQVDLPPFEPVAPSRAAIGIFLSNCDLGQVYRLRTPDPSMTFGRAESRALGIDMPWSTIELYPPEHSRSDSPMNHFHQVVVGGQTALVGAEARSLFQELQSRLQSAVDADLHDVRNAVAKVQNDGADVKWSRGRKNEHQPWPRLFAVVDGVEICLARLFNYGNKDGYHDFVVARKPSPSNDLLNGTNARFASVIEPDTAGLYGKIYDSTAFIPPLARVSNRLHLWLAAAPDRNFQPVPSGSVEAAQTAVSYRGGA